MCVSSVCSEAGAGGAEEAAERGSMSPCAAL